MSANSSFLLVIYISLLIFGQKFMSGVGVGAAIMHFQKTKKQLVALVRASIIVESISFNKIILILIKKCSQKFIRGYYMGVVSKEF